MYDWEIQNKKLKVIELKSKILDLQAEIYHITHEIIDLEREITQEEYKQENVFEPNTCSKCGLILDGIMGYVCSDHKCPIGLGPVIC